jgi:hypothetical protein
MPRVTILAPVSQNDDAAASQSTWSMAVAVAFSSSALASDELHQQETTNLTPSAVDESSYSLRRWLDQDRSQEPWSALWVCSKLQEPSFVTGAGNVLLALAEVKLRARL